MATIDGNSLSSWDIGVLAGSYDSLFKYPKRKAVKFTNYAERDGITPDLRKFETEARAVSINFIMKHNSESEFHARYASFFNLVNGAGYHTFDFDTGLLYRLRYDKTQTFSPTRFFNAGPGATSFTMNFIEDKPAINSSVTSPIGGNPLSGWYRVDGIDFAAFGAHPNGSIGEVLKYPDAKEPFDDGRDIHLDVRKTKHKEITIPLWIHAESKAAFIRNYQAFFNAFRKTGKRNLYIKEIGATTQVYYMECNTFNMHWGSRVGAHFSIRLCIPVATWL